MSWEKDLADAWHELGTTDPHHFVDKIRSIVANAAVPSEIREFELACAHDSTGRSDLAVEGYCRALSGGLTGYRGRRAKIQLASSLRNLGQSDQSVELLEDESTSAEDGLDDAVSIFLALSLIDVGRSREAVARLVHALAEHLPRYTASAHRYADALVAPEQRDQISATQESNQI